MSSSLESRIKETLEELSGLLLQGDTVNDEGHLPSFNFNYSERDLVNVAIVISCILASSHNKRIADMLCEYCEYPEQVAIAYTDSDDFKANTEAIHALFERFCGKRVDELSKIAYGIDQ